MFNSNPAMENMQNPSIKLNKLITRKEEIFKELAIIENKLNKPSVCQVLQDSSSKLNIKANKYA